MDDILWMSFSATDPSLHLGFLGSLISGIFGRKDAKKKARLMEEAAKVPIVTTPTLNLGGLVKDAEAHGFHPQTILNAGGLASYTSTSVTGTGAMAAAEARGNVPSFGSVLSGALGSTIDSLAGSMFSGLSGGTGFGKNFFPNAPMPDMGMSAALGWSAPSAPRIAAGGGLRGGYTNSGSSSYGGTGALGRGQPMLPEVVRPETQNPWKRFNIDYTSPGAAAFEERYGDSELYSMLGGVLTTADDFWYNVTGMTSDDRYKKMGQPISKYATNAFDSVKAGVLTRDPKSDFMSFGDAVFEWFEPWMP